MSLGSLGDRRLKRTVIREQNMYEWTGSSRVSPDECVSISDDRPLGETLHKVRGAERTQRQGDYVGAGNERMPVGGS